VAIVDRTGQTFSDHRVKELAVPHAEPPSGPFQEVWGIAHRLGPTGNHQIGVAYSNGFGGMNHGSQSRPADTIHGFGRCVDRQASLQGSLPGNVHPRAGLKHAAQDDIANMDRIHGRTVHCCAHDNRAKIGSRELLEGTPKRSNGCSTGAQNDSVFHGNSPMIAGL
jgi:hypothetical protein